MARKRPPKKLQDTKGGHMYCNSVLFTADQQKQIDERWAKGDRSVLVMKAMLDGERDAKKLEKEQWLHTQS